MARRIETDKSEREQTFLDHLEELRAVLLKCIIAVVFTSLLSFTFAGQISRVLQIPLRQALTGITLRALQPTEAFLASMKIAFVTGIIVALPVIVYQFWAFIAPGLNPKERRYVKIGSAFSFFQFFLGLFFCYYAILPLAVSFFYRYTLRLGVEVTWSISSYISFTLLLLFGFGVVFELPIVVVILGKLGLVTPQMLSKRRRHAVIIIFVAAAMLTPPDVISQLMMALPMILLYELSILLVKKICRSEYSAET